MSGWITEVWNIHNGIQPSHKKWNLLTWMELDVIILSEVRQSQIISTAYSHTQNV